MQLFWMLACLIVFYLFPERMWKRIFSMKGPYKYVVKIVLLILAVAICAVLVYFLSVLPEKAMGIGPTHVK